MSPYRPPSYLPAHTVPPQGFAPAPGYGYAPPPTFQLADLFRLIDARRRLITRVALGVILCGIAAALILPTTWSSSSVVMLDSRKNNITDLTAVLSQLSADPASMQNQLQLLQSRELAAEVITRLKLDNDPEFNPAIAQPSLVQLVGMMGSLINPRNWFENDTPVSGIVSRDRIIDTFLKHVSANAEGLSTTITVTATSRDPNKAALIANTLADAYVKAQVATKVDATTNTTSWLNTRLSDLAQQLQVQEEAIQRYKALHNLNDSAPGNSLVDQQMGAINAQIVQQRSELAEKQAIQDRINQLVASGNPADVSQIVSSPLIVQLRTQQATLISQESELNSKYGPLHPKMQAIQQQKRDLDFKITQEVNRLAASAGNDVMVSRAHLNSLQGSLGGTEGTARTQNMARVQLQALESNAASTRLQYEAFVQRLRSSQNLDDVQTPDSRIISPAPVPLNPSGPKRALIVGASIPLGLLLGLLAALVAEKIGPLMPVRVNGAPLAALVPVAAPVIKPPRRARPRPAQPQAQHPVAVWSGPPILSEINDPALLRAADFVLDYPASKYSHAMAALVRQLESKEGDGAIVALTSADNSESRSAIAVSLARAAARMGKKAIIVDCAPGHMASRAMKTRIRSGLYEVLTGSVPLNQALAKDPRGDVYLLGTAKRAPNSLTMYSSAPMAKLVQVLRGGADFVVIDCGPANASPDAALIARLADATLLVSKRSALNSPMIANAAKILESARSAPIGIVVTK
ncbi:MAG: lipopolysaccharide biosynthesis protein [Alphaproteobacteria bacterium]|nr:lipopolysaccharide biosynthesis protein [Alphaproteobacteria bacterium]